MTRQRKHARRVDAQIRRDVKSMCGECSRCPRKALKGKRMCRQHLEWRRAYEQTRERNDR